MNQSRNSQNTLLETEHFKVHLNSSATNTSTNNTLLNSTVVEKDCEPPSLTSFTTGPSTSTEVEFNIKNSLVNLITCAYTHSGYPISTTAGNGCNVIYGAYVELRNPSLNSITFPPDEMIVVSDIPRESAEEVNRVNPSSIVSSPNSSGIPATEEPLVRVIWRRGSHLLNGRLAEKLPSTPNTGPLVTSPNSSSSVVLPRLAPSSTNQRLRQCPEGICDVQTSARINEILLGFEPSILHTGDNTTQVNNNTTEFSDNSSNNNDNNNNNEEENVIDPSETVNPPPGTGIPSGEEPNGDMPIQTTLITANSFNHLSTYGVRHQNGKILSTTPLQSIIAAISTRRITAHSIFFLSTIVGENYVAPGYQSGGSPQVLHGAEVKPAKKNWTNRKSSISGAFPNLAKGVEMNFEDIHLEGVGGGVNSIGTNTINVATLHVAVEPYLLFGNQGGDLFLFSLFEGKIIQRLNFSGGGTLNTNSESSNIPRKQVVSAAVTCIVEVECGIEKHLAVVIDRACSSKMRNAKTFTVPSFTVEGVPPSVFAAGFDNGHILLISITMGGACLTEHLTSFGERPIQGIAVQTPHFYLRLWSKQRGTRGVTCSSSQNKQNPQEKEKEEEKKDKENNDCISHIEFISATTLVLCEDSGVVAINCDGGMLRLVKTSNLEVELCRTVALANNTAGDFLAIKWVASSAEFTLYPDLIVVTSEDDSLMVYQFLQISGSSKSKFTSTFSFPEETVSSGQMPNKLLMSNNSQRIGENLVFLERRRFHRSWVGDLCLLPVSDAYLLLIATSYDGRSSFWPLYHGAIEQKSKESFLPPPPSEDASFIQECFYDFIIQDDSNQHISSRLTTSVLTDEPSTAVVLHTDMTVRCTVGGAGCSHFLVSLCLRGRVKFWEVKSVSS